MEERHEGLQAPGSGLQGPNDEGRITKPADAGVDRREFLQKCGVAAALAWVVRVATIEAEQRADYKAADHLYGMAVDPAKCIGCGRCYKVCPRKVFELVERGEDDENYDEDEDNSMVMTLANALDCIGCGSCSRVCPKQCHSHQPMAMGA